mmetsp:Transcript_55852/g.113729  ORF Transcript_55852/g.113729 Transcript_55852/m.113729 type:complete len:209 (+) Transcript_55852:335-961(+)
MRPRRPAMVLCVPPPSLVPAMPVPAATRTTTWTRHSVACTSSSTPAAAAAPHSRGSRCGWRPTLCSSPGVSCRARRVDCASTPQPASCSSSRNPTATMGRACPLSSRPTPPSRPATRRWAEGGLTACQQWCHGAVVAGVAKLMPSSTVTWGTCQPAASWASSTGRGCCMPHRTVCGVALTTASGAACPLQDGSRRTRRERGCGLLPVR